ncbi:hypothetical protein ANAEL_00006 [Anaerolineales bacterium]|nr:hypothetical protein ANAEL_00006 [Anaerolineales bacterium]
MNHTWPAGNEEVFLATTALEDFWDTTKPIVFLGKWCLLYERRLFCETLNSRLLSNPYDSADVAEGAYQYVSNIYEQMLPQLGAALNSIHGKNHSDRYWRILLGPWLQLYLSATYDRFIHIRHALDQYPNCTTFGLSVESFVVPTDTLDFACSLSEDSYNLQLYTRILTELGKKFTRKTSQISRNPLYKKLLGNSWKRKAISYAAKIYANYSAKLFSTILLRSSYFPRQVELRMAAKNIGRILPSWGQVIQPTLESNGAKRSELQKVEIGKSEFERCLSAMLPLDLPQCFMEGFESVERDVRDSYPKKVRGIFSANAWYYDEAFKQWAAASADEGSLLLGTQHGGNYGALNKMPSENHETAIVNYYYSWGWERPGCHARVIPMPATKLVGRNKIGADNSKTGILWVATSAHRYVIQYPVLPIHFSEYLAWQVRFAHALLQCVMPEVRFRPHYENYGWGTVERMKDCGLGIQIESWDVPFQASLENCRLYVCDHLSTTFTEALAANKPTILFWNPQTNELRPEAQPYYDLLRKNGILFDTPESAGEAVNRVYDDVETWWNDPERQHTVEVFCERFARNSPDALQLWSAEFKRIAATSKPKTNRAG